MKILPHLPEVFADGVRQISFSSGVFRMELASLGRVEGNDKQETPPPLEPKQMLLMPVDGFMQMFRSMKDIIDQLLAAGVLRSPDESGKTAVATNGRGPVKAEIPAASKNKGSSNFD